MWLAILQADEDVLVVFQDLTQRFEAIIKPNLFGDLTGLNLCKHFFVLRVVEVGRIHVICIVQKH